MNLRYDTFYIGGEWVRPATDRTIVPVNASTEEPLGLVPEGSEADVDRAVAAARDAFDDPTGWASWEPARRAEVMERLADAIDKRADGFVERVSAQNGMPVAVARQLETGYPSAVLCYYAGLAKELAVTETRPGLFGGSIEVRKAPVGVVAAIVPWNFPHAPDHVQDRAGDGDRLHTRHQALAGDRTGRLPAGRGRGGGRRPRRRDQHRPGRP